MKTVPSRYIPPFLSARDASRQRSSIIRSRNAYKQGRYVPRASVKSYTSRPSGHVTRAKRMYNVPSVAPNRALSKATKCSVSALRKIVNKGKGAYFSSGSRPNQTPSSWGMARLASAITGGKAAAVDYSILQHGCHSTSPALRLANQARQRKTRRTPQTFLH